jgi:hypothetical protein
MPAKKNMQNIPPKYYCETCDYVCSKKSCWTQHILTSKHKNANFMLMPANKKYACEKCDIKFNHQSSYCRHKKKCHKNIKLFENEISDKDLIMMLIKENNDFKTMMIEQQNIVLEIAKNGTTNNSHNNNNTNSHNKTFNLQFFLNETCKDAMNIMDFVDSIKLQLSDLENVGKLGYVEGISNIITNNLKALDVTQRPVHCTDKKREILYIKDEDKWEKEDDDKKKIRTVIKKVASKNSLLIPKFKEVHPDCIKSSSKFSDQYNKLIIESMGGSGDNDLEKEEKIIKNIAKNVIIDK